MSERKESPENENPTYQSGRHANETNSRRQEFRTAYGDDRRGQFEDEKPVYQPEPRDDEWGQSAILRSHGEWGPVVRSDELIREDAAESLNRDLELSAADIDVTVEGGAVTLTGAVPDAKTKQWAADCVEGVQGVVDVRNELRIEPAYRDSDAQY